MSDREPIRGEWCGHERIGCPLCAWDTLNGEAAFRAHLDESHPLPAPKPVKADEPAPEDETPAEQPPTTAPETSTEAVTEEVAPVVEPTQESAEDAGSGITKPSDIGSRPVSEDHAPDDPAGEDTANG